MQNMYQVGVFRMNIDQWGARWNIPIQAINELLAVSLPSGPITPGSEAAVSNQVRLESSRRGGIMWRNNSGAVTTDDGRHIRFGLGNDSKKLNKHFKSSDLIGINPIYITPSHVGHVVGQFMAIENKHGSWKYKATDREVAQWKYLQLVKRYGGIGIFTRSVEDYTQCLNTIG